MARADGVSLMFTIISCSKQRPGCKRPESQGLQHAAGSRWGGETGIEERSRDERASERGVKAITDERAREREREGECWG